MPEERGLYLRMPVLDQLVFFALAVRHAARRRRARRALDWLARFRIAEYADRRAESLSKGNQQKIQFIATILHDPDVLLMDEPFVGLDPVNVALLKSAFLEMRDRGKTIVFSTHQLDMAEELCDSVAIIDHGRVVDAGPDARGQASTGHQVVRVATRRDGDIDWLRSLPHVTVTRPGERLHRAAGRCRAATRRTSCGRPWRTAATSCASRSPTRRSRRSSSSASGRSSTEETTLAARGGPGMSTHRQHAAPSPGASSSSGSGRGASCRHGCSSSSASSRSRCCP